MPVPPTYNDMNERHARNFQPDAALMKLRCPVASTRRKGGGKATPPPDIVSS
jgi:hypothetical protein